MITFISCAKTMTNSAAVEVPFSTLPHFSDEARHIAAEMMNYSAEELGNMLGIKSKLAAENYLRFQDFLSKDCTSLPSLLAYTGIVFKRINPKDFTDSEWEFAQKHLLISSFVFGLLRPLDLIKCYRMEGSVRLPDKNNITLFNYWKPLLTDYFIQTIKRQGNVLFNLASAEMKSLFEWERVEQETEVFTPEFLVNKNGKPKSVTIYAKMCRGEMTRFILKHRIEDPEQLKAFEWEGFAFDKTLSKERHPVFVL